MPLSTSTYLIHGATAADNDGATSAVASSTLTSCLSAGRSSITMYARRALLHAARLGEWVTLGTQAAICRFTLHAAHLYALPTRYRALWEREREGYRKHYKLLQYVLTEKGANKNSFVCAKDEARLGPGRGPPWRSASWNVKSESEMKSQRRNSLRGRGYSGVGVRTLGQARLVASLHTSPQLPSCPMQYVHALTHTNANLHIVCVLSVVAGATRRMCNIPRCAHCLSVLPFHGFFAQFMRISCPPHPLSSSRCCHILMALNFVAYTHLLY